VGHRLSYPTVAR